MDEPHIEIDVNGPYIVSGPVPLTEMAPVHTLNGEPVDWHRLRDFVPGEEPYYLCRCGQSRNKPFCDSSHETNGFDGTETASRASFHDRARVEAAGDYRLADDRGLCLQAGFCRTRTTSVWDLLPEAGNEAIGERLRAMTWACPSGRLALQDAAGHDLEPQLQPEVAAVPGGPLWVRGGITITGSDGTQWETRNRVALCRCGGSANKPFCDGTHRDLHFDER